MRSMVRDFKDFRYIKIGENKNTPILLVYRPEEIPSIRAVSEMWRKLAKDAGFDNLHLIAVQNFSDTDPSLLGFDAACDFAVGYRGVDSFLPCGYKSGVKISDFIKGNKRLNVNTYENVVRRCTNNENITYARYRCATPGWDNTSRKGAHGALALGNTPKMFGKSVLSAALATIVDERINRNGFLFVNAWNEWCEGAHLEPDVRDGYDYLQANKQVMDLKLSHFL